MKHLVIYSIFLVLLITSCAPVYRCGEERPAGGIQGSNRLIAVVEERDQLCGEIKEINKTITVLKNENDSLIIINDSLSVINKNWIGKYDSITNEYDVLKGKYTDLQQKHIDLTERFTNVLTDNLQKGHLFDERLKEKERRLALKEEELLKREQRIKELEAQLARQDSLAARLQQLLQQALLGFDSDELTTTIKNGKVLVSMSDKLMFASGSATVSEKGKKALSLLADVLKKNKNFTILVEGHTDNVAIHTQRYDDNWDLSVDRATSIVRLLQKEHEISPHRLTASGKAKYQPKTSNDTANGRAKNRRTEIILSPDTQNLLNLIRE